MLDRAALCADCATIGLACAGLLLNVLVMEVQHEQSLMTATGSTALSFRDGR